MKLTVPGVGSPCPRGRSFGALGSNGCALCTDSRHIQTPSIRILESPSNLIEPSVYSQLSGLGLAKNWKMFWHVLTTTRYNPAPTFHLFTARSVQTRLSGYTRGSAMFQKSNISCFDVGRLWFLHVGPVFFFGRSKTCWLPWDKLRSYRDSDYIGNYIFNMSRMLWVQDLTDFLSSLESWVHWKSKMLHSPWPLMVKYTLSNRFRIGSDPLHVALLKVSATECCFFKPLKGMLRFSSE